MVAVYKPHGWLTQGDKTGRDTALDWARRWIGEKYQKPGNVFLGLVHRLDRVAAGVLVFAKTSKAASRLSAQIRDHKVDKRYHARVEGQVADQGRLIHFLSAQARPRIRVKDEAFAEGRKSELEYQVLRRDADSSVVEVKLISGRKHQIRAQFSHVGHPLVGDEKYRSSRSFQGDGIALLSVEWKCQHPTSGEVLHIKLPEEFYDLGE